MTRKQFARAIRLADKLIEGVGNPELHQAAVDLRSLLTPPPTIGEVLSKVPGNSIQARAKTIGISRQTYYNLLEGGTRASLPVALRIADVTGVDIEVVKDLW